MAEEKWLVDGPKVIDLEGPRRLKVGLIGGQVDVVAHDAPGFRVEVHSVSGKALKVSSTDTTIEIDHAQLSWENWLDAFRNLKPGAARADVSVLVPRGTRLTLGIVSASALVSGIEEEVDLSTVTGDIVADGISGDLTLNSVSGELTVRNHHGRVITHTVSGDVTASGTLLAFSCDGVSGDIFLDVAGIPDEIKINTVSGGVTTRFPAGVPVAYTIGTATGKLQLDDSSIRGVRGRFTGKYGELEKHWTDFRVNTVSGDVSVVHAERVDAP